MRVALLSGDTGIRLDGCLFMAAMFRRIDEVRWLLPKEYKRGMRVPGLLYATEKLASSVEKGAVEQMANVATLPGIYKYSYGMPDLHEGYGFPIGGVAAFDAEEGVISPGGVGFDINCGVRLLTTELAIDEIRPSLQALINAMFTNVPSGVGSQGKIRLSRQQTDAVLANGARWAVEQGYGWQEDLGDRVGTMTKGLLQL